MESQADKVRAFVLTLLFHAGLVGLIWWSADWVLPDRELSAAGPPVQATLMVSTADIRRAQQAIKASPKPAKPDEQAASPPPQPKPAPRPQTSDLPPQDKPQAPLEKPDTEDQERIARNALLQAEKQAKEQEERRRQEQIDLTENIARQQEAERRQRLREQYEAARRESEAAQKRTRMEEQRLKQLADLQSKPAPAPPQSTPAPAAGNMGSDEGLRARYIAALNAAARANWNTAAVPQMMRCSVSFRQIRGGEVIKVEFIDCPYDPQVRDSVERALLKSPMPYSGFENVFTSPIKLTMCYPEEACQR